MSKIRGLVMGVALCLAFTGTMALAGQEENYTVGEFATQLAKMVTNKADFSAEEAAAYLKQVGVELGDLDATVDEAVFVGAFNRLGVNMVTARPEAEISSGKAGQVFQMFDANDTLFTGELFKTCQQGDGEPHQCITDADCTGGTCDVVSSIQCKGGSSAGSLCMSDGDCPGGTCKIPPGQAKKLDLASPND
jgi:hypothetical protein